MSVDPYPGVDAAQPFDATLTALSGLTTGANLIAYFTDVDTADVTPLTPFARTLLDDPDQASMWATLGLETLGTVGGTGLAEKVAFWSNEDTLASDTDLHWDAANNRLGIGTSTPVSRLHVAAASGVGTGILNVRETDSTLEVRSHAYWDTNVGVNVLNIGATTLGTVTKVTGVAVGNFPAVPPGGQAIGYWTGMNAGPNRYGFYAGGTADNIFMGKVGIGLYVPNHWLHVQGDVGIATTLLVQGGTTLNGGLYVPGRINVGSVMASTIGYGWDPSRWPLDINGQGHVFQLGVYYGPPSAVWFRTASAAVDSLSIARGDTAPRWQLDCEGWGYVGKLGVYYGPDVANNEGVDLRVYRGKFDKLSAGRGLGVNDFYGGYCQIDALYLGGNGQPNWTLQAEGACMIRRLGVGIDPNPLPDNSMQAVYIGVGYAPHAGYSIRAGNSHFDAIGCGYAGGSGYNLRAGSTYVDAFTAAGNTALNGYTAVWGPPDSRWAFINWNTSYFAGSVQFAQLTGFGYAPQAGYWIRAGASYFDSIATGGLSTGGGITIGTDLVVGNWAGKPGGGMWADSSSKNMKTNIVPISGALALLLAQQGWQYEWTEPQHRAVLPGLQYGFLLEDVTIPQWIQPRPGDTPLLAIKGFEALTVEALRQVVQRLEAIEAHLFPQEHLA